MKAIIQEIFNAILSGNIELAKEKTEIALGDNLDPSEILNAGMIAAMAEVGERFEQGDYFAPEMLVSARAMQQGLSILKPHLQQVDLVSQGKVVIGAVKGDLHDIGKNLVIMMLEGAGFEVIDLGINVPSDMFIEAINQEGAEIVAMSSLLTTTKPNMKVVIDSLSDAGVRDQVKVIIGGAPVTQDFADEIGANGYAADASRAVKLAKSLVQT